MAKHLFTIPNGTVLPDPVGLPDGYPFRLDPAGTIWAIQGGAWVELVISPAGYTPPPAALPPDASPFRDDFDRTDRLLAGDNGWFNPTTNVATIGIVGNAAACTVVSPAKTDPILHVRGGSTDVADLSIDWTFIQTSGLFPSLTVCSDVDFTHYVEFAYNKNAGGVSFLRVNGTDTSFPSFTTFNGGWAAISANPTRTRIVYTDATKLCEVYQNGVKKLSCDMSAAHSGLTDELPSLASMAYMGFTPTQDVGFDSFDNLVCA